MAGLSGVERHTKYLVPEPGFTVCHWRGSKGRKFVTLKEEGGGTRNGAAGMGWGVLKQVVCSDKMSQAYSIYKTQA